MAKENRLESLSVLERYFLGAVLVLGRSCITHIREFLRLSDVLESYYNFPLRTEDASRKLREASLITIGGGGVYMLHPDFTYDEFREVAMYTETLILVRYCHEGIPGKVLSSSAGATRRQVYANCAAVYVARDDYDSLNVLYLSSKAWSDSPRNMGSRANDMFFIQDVSRVLLRFPDFSMKMIELSPRIVEAFFPHALLCSVFTYEPRLMDWLLFVRAHQPKVYLPFALAALLEGDRASVVELCDQGGIDRKVKDGLLSFLDGKWEEASALLTPFCNRLLGLAAPMQAVGALIQLLCLVPEVMTASSDSRLNTLWRRIKGSAYYDSVEDFKAYFSHILDVRSNVESARHFVCVLDMSELPLYLALLGHCVGTVSSYTEADCDNAYKVGQWLMSHGRRFMGIQILNAVGTLMNKSDSRRAEIARVTRESLIVPYLEMRVKKHSWEVMLEDLDALLDKCSGKQESQALTEDDLQGMISWHLYATRSSWSGFCYSMPCLEDISPMFHRLLKNGTYGTGKNLRLKDVEQGIYDRFLSEKERLAFKRYRTSGQFLLKESAIEYLVDSEHVYVGDGERPVKLVKENVPIVSSVSEDGAISLRLKYTGGVDGLDHYFLDDSEPGICRFCLVKGDEPLKQLFRRYGGPKQTLVVPRDGAEQMKELLVKATSNYTLSGDLEMLAFQSLPRQEGRVELHVLLKRKGDAFVFDVRNKPLADRELLFPPGRGAVERVITMPDGQQSVLVRNLDGENVALGQLAENCASLPKEIVENPVCESADFGQSLAILSELKESGIAMDWQSDKPVRVTRAIGSGGLRLSNASAQEWFSIGGELRVSESDCVRLNELLKAVEGRTGCFVKLSDDAYLQLTQELVKKLELLKAAGTMRNEALEIAPAALPMLSSEFEGELPESLELQVDKVRQAFAAEVSIPETLAGTLRSYQEAGFRYLARLADCGIGCCLADDMGLGKTIQILALLLREAEKGAALVVCPASLVSNWHREAGRFAPSLNVTELPLAEDRKAAVKGAGKSDVIVCSYGIMLSESKLLASKAWHAIILDEAQAIKNHTAKRSKSSKQLKGDVRIAVTGTPIENHLLELWSIFDFLNPGLLGTSGDFDCRFCRDGMATPELKKLVSPLILRRRKSDVLDDLPPKTEIVLPVELPQEERAMYETLRRNAMSTLTGEQRTHVRILAELSRLQTFCCAPELIYGQEFAGEGAKLQRLMELVHELKEEGHRALVFSRFVKFLTIFRKKLDALGITYQYLDGEVPSMKRQASVDAFQKGEGDFFLISLMAGGTGLNLTAADYVVLADPWWNPAVEDQASDRAHRIGQLNPVTVCRLIVSQTVEERILELHGRKRQASSDLLDNAQSTGITIDDLMSLFG